jgi:hypothetical protein
MNRLRVLIVFAALTLAVPPVASAHGRSAAVAVDYRARIFALSPRLRGVIAVRLYESDRAVRITVSPGHTARVLGYLREPFIRIDSAGVAVNASAPTAGSSGLTKLLRSNAHGWQPLSTGRSVTWHNNELRALPPGVDRARWTIPLIVDGQPVRLEGELRRLPPPALWPWLVAGVPFLLVSLLVWFRRRSLISLAAAGFGAAAGLGMVASGAGLALDPSSSGGKWAVFANELVIVLVAVAVFVRGSADARGIAGGALGLLTLWIALSQYQVLVHAVVLSVFPWTVARALVALTVWSAATATAFGLIVFGAALERPDESNRIG